MKQFLWLVTGVLLITTAGWLVLRIFQLALLGMSYAHLVVLDVVLWIMFYIWLISSKWRN